MSEPKTRPHDADVDAFLDAVDHPERRADAHRLKALFEELTGEPAVMWGPSIVGFGAYDMTYADGSTRPWMLTGFSPRKARHSLYVMDGFDGYEDLLARLGKHRRGRSCLYVNRLADVDEGVLRELITASVAAMKAKHGA